MGKIKKLRKSEWTRIIIIAFLLIFLTISTIKTVPFFLSLDSLDEWMALKDRIQGYGSLSVCIFIAAQFLQVVIAFIPGEPFEIVSGILFGVLWGTVLCLMGITIGTAVVYYLVKTLGKPFINIFFSSEKMNKFSILREEKKLKTLIFILFLIPGTPKDLLVYIAPLTKVPPREFFLISVFARLPSVVSSVIVGATLQEGNFTMSAVVLFITAVIGIIGIRYNDKFIKKRENEDDK